MNANMFIRLSAILLAALVTTGPAAAQSLFSPVVHVNESVVTEFEIEQRLTFLRALNSPGATRDKVLETLIDERLQEQATKAVGLELSEEGVEAGMEDFASRANLKKDEFIEALVGQGIDEETFRDFVKVNATWRELIRGRYGNRVDVSETEIDRALAATGGASGIRILVSEIIIPAPPERAEEVRVIADQIAASESEAEFSAYAQEYSATASRDVGGRLPWQQLTNLPPTLRPILLDLAPGEVTAPLPIPNAVALFMLRGIEETTSNPTEIGAIEYAVYYIPGGRSDAALKEAERVKARVDVCDDLYGIAYGKPEEVLERSTKAPGEIPSDIAIELSKLDEGEISTALTSPDGQALALIMMCGRTAVANTDVSREDVAASLRQSRLAGYSQGLLEQLRAEARIVFVQ